jgi:hypothetical protein
MELTASLLNPSPTDGFLTVVVDGKQHTILEAIPCLHLLFPLSRLRTLMP